MPVASPIQKHKVITMMKPSIALRITAQVMALGNVSDASLISSAIGSYRLALHAETDTVPHLHICTPQSKPNMDTMEVDRPTITDVPVLLHPPPLLNSVKTAAAVFLGASTHKGITIANRPTIWIIRISPSTIGSFLAKKVLKRIAKEVIAMTSMVPCQRSKM